ncbi:hypothetical protein TWF281_001604 [Arthrobotrys megalospora]
MPQRVGHPAQPHEPDVKYLKQLYGFSLQQIYLRNGPFPGDEKEMYRLELAMVRARYTFFLDEMEAQPGEGNFRWIGDTTDPKELRQYFENVKKAPIMCYAQPHSAIKGKFLDPMIFCDPKTGYSIHLHTSMDQQLQVPCSAAAKIAWQWAKANRNITVDSDSPGPIRLAEAIPTYPGREWQTIGQSFLSERPDWMVYIGKQDCRAHDPERLWPGYKNPPPLE